MLQIKHENKPNQLIL